MLITNYATNLMSIYEWKNGRFSVKVQDVPVINPYRCDTFSINNTTYIACGRGFNNDSVSVFKWSGSRFELFQNLFSLGVYGQPHSFNANGTLYLAIANYATVHMILIRIFTSGMAPSLSTTSPSPLMARGSGTHLKPPKGTCS